MKLTWRDAAATALVAGVAGCYWAYRAGGEAPLVSGPRPLAVVSFLLGVIACAVGGGGVIPGSEQTGWARVFGLHGAVAFVLMLLVLITASTSLLAILVALVVLLWVVTTLRHGLTRAQRGHATGRGQSPERVAQR